MALKPPTVKDPQTQQTVDYISNQFPLGPEHLGNAAKELFPQLASAGATKIAFGSATVSQTEGSHFTSEATVTHGLGTTPVAVVASSDNSAISVATKSYGETTFKVQGYNVFGTEKIATINVRWIALG